MESEKPDKVAVEKTREEKIVKAKELYSNGSRNFLIKNYSDAADELSQVCELFGEVYGEFSDELGMPYLLYAKSLIALALDENKVIDVPEEEDDEDDEEDDESNDGVEQANKEKSSEALQTNGNSSENKRRLECFNENEVDSTEKDELQECDTEQTTESNLDRSGGEKGDATVTSTEDSKLEATEKNGTIHTQDKGKMESCSATDEKPSTSNGQNADNTTEDDVGDENEAATNLQLAWEILETAAKIFSRQGMNGLPNLADVQTELGNIELENNIPEGAREDYEKALKIYKDLIGNYRRAMAEIHYKIGLTFLMQQMNKEAANSLKEACTIIEDEIIEINSKENVTEKDKNTIQDMQETKQEILDKIAEIEETQHQNIAEVRAALKNFITPDESKKQFNDTNSAGPSSTSTTSDNAGISSSSSSISSSTLKANDISHLIKRKKPDSPANSEAEALESPMKKRPV